MKPKLKYPANIKSNNGKIKEYITTRLGDVVCLGNVVRFETPLSGSGHERSNITMIVDSEGLEETVKVDLEVYKYVMERMCDIQCGKYYKDNKPLNLWHLSKVNKKSFEFVNRNPFELIEKYEGKTPYILTGGTKTAK